MKYIRPQYMNLFEVSLSKHPLVETHREIFNRLVVPSSPVRREILVTLLALVLAQIIG
jgi:hypothetical protein